MAGVADQIDDVLEKLEMRLDKVKEAQGSKVKLTRAEMDLLACLEEVRDLLQDVVKSGDREVLKDIFGGDCSRSGRVRAIIDTVVLSPMNAKDQRLPTCRCACEGVEGLLSDIGQSEELAKAIAAQKAKLGAEKDRKAAAAAEQATKDAEAKARAEEEKAAAAAAAEEALGTHLAEHKKKNSAEIKESLERGVGIMRDRFSYKYPTDADAARVEEAKQGAAGLYVGVAKLAVEFSTADEFNDHLGEYKADWAKIIKYLYGMYQDPAGRHYRGRLQFCVGKLIDMSPEFLQALVRQPDIMDTMLAVQADVQFKDQKPGVVWVDYREKAYQGNEMLNNNPKLVLKGFCDNEASKGHQTREEWLAYIIDRASSPEARVACVICNKRHLRMFREITGYCELLKLPSPKFVIVTRESSYNAEEFTKLGIPLDMVTTDWIEAGKLAVNVIDTLS